MPLAATVTTVSDLLTVKSITEEPGTYIRRHGRVVAEFAEAWRMDRALSAG
jgi:hypothetical protein